jgi:hypothetical protein
MKEKHIHVLSIVLALFYTLFIAWLYWTEPKTLIEASTKAQTTIENVATKGQVVIGTYEVDKDRFEDGLMNFYKENYVAARDNFGKADPEQRDARTQFYIAYSFYRQGWGRISNDDALFKQGLEQTNRVIAVNKNFKSDDANLQMKTSAELKNEFEQGLQITTSDFNPLKILRERK